MKRFQEIIILSLSICALLLIACGTEPQNNPGDVRLEIQNNQPYIYIVPPEEPSGTENSLVVDHSETHDGLWRSYTERIEYDNITIHREISDIVYYSYWRHGLIKSYEEERNFEPSGVRKDIEVDHCLYDYSRRLINYEAIVNGVPYYYAGHFDPDSADYGEFPTR